MRIFRALILSAFLALAVAPPALARSASDFFAAAPQSVIKLLPQSTRLDMMDYFNFGSAHTSENTFGGECKITAISENTLSLDLDEKVKVQLAVIPAKTDTVIAVVYTYLLPVPDSDIVFFDSDWNTLSKSPVELPDYSDWLTPEGKKNIADINLYLPFIPVEASFDENASTLTLGNNAEAYLADDFSKISPDWMIPSMVFSIEGKKFKRIK